MSEVKEIAPKSASTDPKSLQNGLGLDSFIPQVSASEKPAEPPSTPQVAATPEPKVEKPKEAPKDSKQDPEPTPEPTDLKTLEKRLKDTRDSFTKERKARTDLEKEVKAMRDEQKVLKAQLEGTYIAPAEPSAEERIAQEKTLERVRLSKKVAEDKLGVDLVDKLVWADDSPYKAIEQADPYVKARVFGSDSPVEEAVKVVKEHEFFEKYGRDPEKIKEAIYAEVHKQIETELKKAGKGKTIESVNGLSGVNGVPKDQQPKDAKLDLDLGSIFPMFPTGIPQ